jgi:hypothetical protein
MLLLLAIFHVGCVAPGKDDDGVGTIVDGKTVASRRQFTEISQEIRRRGSVVTVSANGWLLQFYRRA